MLFGPPDLNKDIALSTVAAGSGGTGFAAAPPSGEREIFFNFQKYFT